MTTHKSFSGTLCTSENVVLAYGEFFVRENDIDVIATHQAIVVDGTRFNMTVFLKSGKRVYVDMPILVEHKNKTLEADELDSALERSRDFFRLQDDFWSEDKPQ